MDALPDVSPDVPRTALLFDPSVKVTVPPAGVTVDEIVALRLTATAPFVWLKPEASIVEVGAVVMVRVPGAELIA